MATRMMNDNLSVLLPFDYVDAVNTATRWRRWHRSFDYYIEASGPTEPAQKKALLLHTASINE